MHIPKDKGGIFMQWVGIVFIVFIGDCIIKNWIEKRQTSNTYLFNQKVVITKCHNYGAAFNLGEKYPKVILTISSILVGGGLFLFLNSIRKKKDTIFQIGMTLLLGGGLSNVYDRIKRGYVVDYFKFNTRWKKINRMFFNLSDFAIFLGGIILFINQIRKK